MTGKVRTGVLEIPNLSFGVGNDDPCCEAVVATDKGGKEVPWTALKGLMMYVRRWFVSEK